MNNSITSAQIAHKISDAIYQQALKDFPYPNLTATDGYSIFEFPDPALVSSLAYDFDAEKLVEELGSRGKLSSEDTVDGWVMIDFYNNNGELRIEAVGDIARNGDWEEGRFLSEIDMIFGDYDIQKREWNFWVAH